MLPDLSEVTSGSREHKVRLGDLRSGETWGGGSVAWNRGRNANMCWLQMSQLSCSD